ncbi:hypothetical protein FRC17_001038 [Serendipita sp. 399]|nr:hypothetical protein FRC17_001038 [Serendipita sp. 399]
MTPAPQPLQPNPPPAYPRKPAGRTMSMDSTGSASGIVSALRERYTSPPPQAMAAPRESLPSRDGAAGRVSDMASRFTPIDRPADMASFGYSGDGRYPRLASPPLNRGLTNQSHDSLPIRTPLGRSSIDEFGKPMDLGRRGQDTTPNPELRRPPLMSSTLGSGAIGNSQTEYDIRLSELELQQRELELHRNRLQLAKEREALLARDRDAQDSMHDSDYSSGREGGSFRGGWGTAAQPRGELYDGGRYGSRQGRYDNPQGRDAYVPSYGYNQSRREEQDHPYNQPPGTPRIGEGNDFNPYGEGRYIGSPRVPGSHTPTIGDLSSIGQGVMGLGPPPGAARPDMYSRSRESLMDTSQKPQQLSPPNPHTSSGATRSREPSPRRSADSVPSNTGRRSNEKEKGGTWIGKGLKRLISIVWNDARINPALSSRASPTFVMTSRQPLPALRTQRTAAPSTISKTSSESSNATIRAPVRTPRAESPTTRQAPFSRGASRANRMSISLRKALGINEGWDGPGLDNTVWEEGTVLDGLTWRMEQFLDIQPPYGLIIPEMVEIANQDLRICGPALDMLVSATLADGSAPIWELPVVETNSSGIKQSSQTLPFSDLNCPEALRGLFRRWANAATRVQKLESHLQQEIARNICDMELTTNVVVPQVNDLAKEFKGIALEILRRRTFISRVTEQLKEELRRNDRTTLLLPKNRGRLEPLPEYPPNSRGSSRSSSRSSNHQRGPSQSRGGSGTHDASGEGGVYQSQRSRSSSVSLRLDENGVPLPEPVDEGGEGIVNGSEMSSAIINSGPMRPSSRNQQTDSEILYGVPLNIPAFSPGGFDAPTAPAAPSNLPAAEIPTGTHVHIAPLPSSDSTSAPTSTSTSNPQDSTPMMYPGTRTFAPVQVPSYLPPTAPLGVIQLQPVASNGPIPSAPTVLRGPRPLPQPPRPTIRSPQVPAEPPSSTPAKQTPFPINYGPSFVVPGHAGPSAGVFDVRSIQVPSQVTISVPSDIPAQLEVSSSSRFDIKAARRHYARSSSSSLSSDHDQNEANLRKSKRNGTVQPVNSSYAGIYGGIAGLYEGDSSNPLIPNWNDASQRNPSHIPKVEKPPKEHGRILKDVKAWISRNNQSNLDTQPRQYEYQPAHSTETEQKYGQLGVNQRAPSPYTPPPDTGLSYYYNPSPSSSDVHINGAAPSSSASVRMHPPATNGVHPLPHPVPVSNQSTVPPYMVGSSQVSPGYAEAFQANPVAARKYHGAGPSGSISPPALAPITPPSTSLTNGKSSLSPNPPGDEQENPDLVAIQETMYGAMIDALASEALQPVIAKDAKRAYFSAVCLAVLNVGMTLQPESNDTPNLITMMSREIRLTDLPGAYKTCFTQLAAIGREARKLRQDDDERAIAYVARGKALPEPRIGRVQKLLERGVGYVGPDGRIRGTSNSSGGTGRSREFTGKINALALDIMKLHAFREDMLPILVA